MRKSRFAEEQDKELSMTEGECVYRVSHGRYTKWRGKEVGIQAR